MAVKKDAGTASLRDIIQQAMTAYELAVIASARTERKAQHSYRQRLADIDTQERADHEAQDRIFKSQAGTAAAEATRVEALALLVEDLKKSAASLLELAALAHVRGFSAGPVEPVQAHAATDEETASAFTAAQVASVELRTAMLKLAEAYLDNCEWEQARRILTPLRTESGGAFLDEATTLLHASYLNEGASALASHNWEQARRQTEEALKLAPGNGAATRLLREISLQQARETLAGGDPHAARTEAIHWLEAHNNDADFQDVLLKATLRLADDAVAADRLADASKYLTSAVTYVGDPVPIRDWTRRDPMLAWMSGQASLLDEFGGHDQPVQALAFTSDGQSLISLDGVDAKAWSVSGTGHDRLPRTIPMPDAYGLTRNALLALNTAGELQSTQDGTRAGKIKINASGKISSLAFSANGILGACATRRAVNDYRFRSDSSGVSGFHAVAPEHRIYVPGSSEDRIKNDALAAQLSVCYMMRQSGNAGKWTIEDAFSGEPRNIDIRDSMGYIKSTEVEIEVNDICSYQVYELTSGRVLQDIKLKRSCLFLSLSLSSDGALVASLNPSGELIINDTDSGATRHTFEVRRSEGIHDMAGFSPSDDLIVVAQAHGWGRDSHSTLSAWEVATGRLAWSWETEGAVGAFAFSPNGRLIAALNTDGTIAAFDGKSQQAVSPIGFHGKAEFPSLAFSPDGSRLATSGDRTVKIWGLPWD